MTNLYRKRLIPEECIHLNNDKIVYKDNSYIITEWSTLHPKLEFSHGVSIYCIDEGWKISKFFKPDNSLCYIYCDIIDTEYAKDTDTYIFTDLLADVIIENNGFVRVVDLDELADACSQGIISNEMLEKALRNLNKLLTIIYNNELSTYINKIDSLTNN